MNMNLIHLGLQGRISTLVLAALCIGATAFAAQTVSSTAFDSTTTVTIITGYGGGNGNQTGQGQANGFDNGNGLKNGMTIGTATSTASAATSTATATATVTGTTSGISESFVSPVPEPSDYALMLTGLAMLIAGVKRRGRASSSASRALA